MSKKIKVSPSVQAPGTDTLVGDRHLRTSCPNHPTWWGLGELCSTFDLAHPLCPLSLSMFWGMLQPSLPPGPIFPKSPSPQENTKPKFKNTDIRPASHNISSPKTWSQTGLTFISQSQVCASLLPHATWLLCDQEGLSPTQLQIWKQNQAQAPRKQGKSFPHKMKANTAHIFMNCPRLGAYLLWKSADGKLVSNKNMYNQTHFGLQLCCVIPMSQAAVLSETPGVQFTTGWGPHCELHRQYPGFGLVFRASISRGLSQFLKQD